MRGINMILAVLVVALFSSVSADVFSVTIVPYARIDLGQSIVLTALPNSTSIPPYKYDWYGGSVGPRDPGCTSIHENSTASITYAPTINSSISHCEIIVYVTDATNTTLYNPLYVPTVYSDPSVSAGPSSITVDAGQNAIFSASVAYGSGSFAYQWYNASNGNSLVGTLSTSNSITIHGGRVGSFYYFANVMDTGTTTNAVPESIYGVSGNVLLIVDPLLMGNIYPVNPVIDNGQHITLHANVTGGTPPYAYQWYSAIGPGVCSSSDTAISGATSNTYTVQPASNVYYCYIAEDSAPTKVSFPSQVDLITVNPVPSLAAMPSSVVIDQSQSLAFSTNVLGGTGSFAYQWYNASIGSGVPISYATLNDYSLSGGNTGNFIYYAVATDIGTSPDAAPQISAESNNALLGVLPYPTINIIPASSQINITGSVLLDAVVSGGTGSFAYQWYNASSGIGIVMPGAITNALTVNGNAGGSYIYYVKATDIGTYANALPSISIQSANAVVVVKAKAKVNVTMVPQNAIIDAGESVSFTNITTGGTPPYAFAYTVNAISANTFSNSVIENGNGFTFAEAGVYNITLSAKDTDNVIGSATSHVTVNPALNVSISPVYSTLVLNTSQPKHFLHCDKEDTTYMNGVESGFCRDDCRSEDSTIYTSNVVLNSIVTGGTPPYAYQWYNVTTGTPATISGATMPSYTVYAGALGLFKYYLQVTDSVVSSAISNDAAVQVCTNRDAEWDSVDSNVSLISGASIAVAGNTFGLSVSVLNNMARCSIVLKHVHVSGEFNVSDDGVERTAERSVNFLVMKNGTLSLPSESREREGPNGYRLYAGNTIALNFNGSLYNGESDEVMNFISGQQYTIKLKGEEGISSEINVTAT